MLHYYLWSDQINIPGNLSGSTHSFFLSLLSSADRFSWISDQQQIFPYRSSLERIGFHYILVNFDNDPSDLTGVITLVAPNSSAAIAGLKRGDYFKMVNGQQLLPSNKESIIQILENQNNLSLQFAQRLNNSWSSLGTKNLVTSSHADKSVYATRVFSKNGSKTGYLFYNSFNENNDQELITAFSKLRNEAVSEMIIDLRYNAGGAVSSCGKLAILLSLVIRHDDVFVRYKGNSNLGWQPYNFDKVLSTSGSVFSELQPNRLSLQRVFILSSPATASAAELLINNLRVYLPVVHIGDKTLGKDEGSIVIKDKRQPAVVKWVINPIVFKLYNASGQGDYPQGIAPQHLVKEYSQLPLYPPGNTQDLLINKSLQLIYGSTDGLDSISLRQQQARKINIAEKSIIYNSIKKYSEHVAPVVVEW